MITAVSVVDRLELLLLLAAIAVSISWLAFCCLKICQSSRKFLFSRFGVRVPEAPQALLTGLHSTSLTLHLTSNGQFHVSHYLLELEQQYLGTWEANRENVEITNLRPATCYTIRVKAVFAKKLKSSVAIVRVQTLSSNIESLTDLKPYLRPSVTNQKDTRTSDHLKSHASATALLQPGNPSLMENEFQQLEKELDEVQPETTAILNSLQGSLQRHEPQFKEVQAFVEAEEAEISIISQDVMLLGIANKDDSTCENTVDDGQLQSNEPGRFQDSVTQSDCSDVVALNNAEIPHQCLESDLERGEMSAVIPVSEAVVLKNETEKLESANNVFKQHTKIKNADGSMASNISLQKSPGDNLQELKGNDKYRVETPQSHGMKPRKSSQSISEEQREHHKPSHDRLCSGQAIWYNGRANKGLCSPKKSPISACFADNYENCNTYTNDDMSPSARRFLPSDLFINDNITPIKNRRKSKISEKDSEFIDAHDIHSGLWNGKKTFKRQLSRQNPATFEKSKPASMITKHINPDPIGTPRSNILPSATSANRVSAECHQVGLVKHFDHLNDLVEGLGMSYDIHNSLHTSIFNDTTKLPTPSYESAAQFGWPNPEAVVNWRVNSTDLKSISKPRHLAENHPIRSGQCHRSKILLKPRGNSQRQTVKHQ